MSTSTSLVVASCKGHTEVVAALVEHKATDVNATVSGGWTALMWAAWWECPYLRMIIYFGIGMVTLE